MPPAGTRATGRGRVVSHEAAGEFLFEIGPLRYRLSIGAAEARSPLLRIEASVDGGEWRRVCDDAGMLIRLPSGAVLSPSQAGERIQVE